MSTNLFVTSFNWFFFHPIQVVLFVNSFNCPLFVTALNWSFLSCHLSGPFFVTASVLFSHLISAVIPLSSLCHSFVIPMSSLRNHFVIPLSSLCHSFVIHLSFLSHPYIIPLSTLSSSLCHPFVILMSSQPGGNYGDASHIKISHDRLAQISKSVSEI